MAEHGGARRTSCWPCVRPVLGWMKRMVPIISDKGIATSSFLLLVVMASNRIAMASNLVASCYYSSNALIGKHWNESYWSLTGSRFSPWLKWCMLSTISWNNWGRIEALQDWVGLVECLQLAARKACSGTAMMNTTGCRHATSYRRVSIMSLFTDIIWYLLTQLHFVVLHWKPALSVKPGHLVTLYVLSSPYYSQTLRAWNIDLHWPLFNIFQPPQCKSASHGVSGISHPKRCPPAPNVVGTDRSQATGRVTLPGTVLRDPRWSVVFWHSQDCALQWPRRDGNQLGLCEMKHITRDSDKEVSISALFQSVCAEFGWYACRPKPKAWSNFCLDPFVWPTQLRLKGVWILGRLVTIEQLVIRPHMAP